MEQLLESNKIAWFVFVGISWLGPLGCDLLCEVGRHLKEAGWVFVTNASKKLNQTMVTLGKIAGGIITVIPSSFPTIEEAMIERQLKVFFT